VRRSICFAIAIWISVSTAAWAKPKTPDKGVSLKVLTDRPEAVYHVGETVVFKIVLAKDGKPVIGESIAYILANDGLWQVDRGTLPLTGKPLTVKGRLDAPGFLRCKVSYEDKDKKGYNTLAAAGFDPLDIKPSLPVPDDFDAFWAGKKKDLAKVPMKPVLTPTKSPDEAIACFDVQVRCLGGMPVSGYFARPKASRPKRLPAILSVHGAGVRSSSLGVAVRDAQYGALALDINAHGLPNGRPKQYYRDLKDGRLKGYPLHGRENRETSYFLGMYLRLMRAMDFLTAQPEWDGRTLIVHGSSQGGGQSIVAAGLDPRVTAFAANVPAMCEHTGKINGWPRLARGVAEGKADPKILQAARYFDAMNFATRTRAAALVSVGFIDSTCRPTSVYAAYNNLRGKKRITNEPMMTHTRWPSYEQAEQKLIEEHIAKMKR